MFNRSEYDKYADGFNPVLAEFPEGTNMVGQMENDLKEDRAADLLKMHIEGDRTFVPRPILLQKVQHRSCTVQLSGISKYFTTSLEWIEHECDNFHRIGV